MDNLYQEMLEKEAIKEEVNISLGDDEIVSVLMRCHAGQNCEGCPYDELHTVRCRDILLNECIGLINRLKKAKEDVAEEIFAEIDDFQRTLRHIFLDMCGGNDYNTLNLLQIDSAIEALFDSRIAELKKKYTEDNK